MTSNRLSTSALRAIAALSLGVAMVGCGIPWRNLQSGLNTDGSTADTTHPIPDVLFAIDAADDARPDDTDANLPDAGLDATTLGDSAMDVPVVDTAGPVDSGAIDTSDSLDAIGAADSGADVTDASIADIVDSSDAQPTCFGITGTCSAIAPCCEGLNCIGGTCTSPCAVLGAICSGSSGCCSDLNCSLGPVPYCTASSCRGLHQSCSASNPCCVGVTCVGGTCHCPIGQNVCSALGATYCADLQTNKYNCGSCTHVCFGTQQCVRGSCH